MSKRLTQSQLDEVLQKHEFFRAGRSGGARAILQFYDLAGMSFRNKDLSQVDLTGSTLIEADFENAILDNAVLFGCDMRFGNFKKTSFVKADMRGVRVDGAELIGANLTKADLRVGHIMEKQRTGEYQMKDRHVESLSTPWAILMCASACPS